jgi:5'-3' exonuclease
MPFQTSCVMTNRMILQSLYTITLILLCLQERYYKEKLEMPDAGPASTHEVVQHYIRGLHWVSAVGVCVPSMCR